MAAFVVRFTMIYISVSMSKIWFPDHPGPPLYTSLRLVETYDKEEEETRRIGLLFLARIMVLLMGLIQNWLLLMSLLQTAMMFQMNFRES